MDIHTTQRAQDEIFAKGLHRSLYIWNSADGKPVLELAKEDIVSGGGLVHTFKLRDDAYFHHGRRMTADDIIWPTIASWTAPRPIPARAMSA